MRRRLLAVVVLVVLAGSAGCTGLFGPGEVDPDRLDEPGRYDWNTTANATLTVEPEGVRAVYTVENRSRFEIYRFERFNNERPVDPAAVKFRFPNGTVVDSDAMTFEKTRSRTVIGLPADGGQLAMTLPKQGKRLRTPTVVEGSYEVILPDNAHVRYFLLGRVAPAAADQFVDEDGHVHLRWDEVTTERIVVEYYLERDLVIFTAVLAIGGVALLGGLGYFWLQLRELRERRESVAWEDAGRP